jgi:hypothetical protein
MNGPGLQVNKKKKKTKRTNSKYSSFCLTCNPVGAFTVRDLKHIKWVETRESLILLIRGKF